MSRKSRADLETAPVRLVPSVELELPPAPAHLSAAMKQWWDAVNRDFALDPHHLLLLQGAAEAWDRTQEAGAVLRAEGISIPTADGGKKQHPAVNVERDSRLAFARLVRELDLDCEAPPERPAWRPPALRSNRRR
jgi:P27 family predicted phage terminase small subunit